MFRDRLLCVWMHRKILVRSRRLELPRVAPLAPQASASTVPPRPRPDAPDVTKAARDGKQTISLGQPLRGCVVQLHQAAIRPLAIAGARWQDFRACFAIRGRKSPQVFRAK